MLHDNGHDHKFLVRYHNSDTECLQVGWFVTSAGANNRRTHCLCLTLPAPSSASTCSARATPSLPVTKCKRLTALRPESTHRGGYACPLLACADLTQLLAHAPERAQCVVRFWNGAEHASEAALTLWISEAHLQVAMRRLAAIHGPVTL